MEWLNTALAAMLILLTVFLAASVLLYLLRGVLEGVTLTLAGTGRLLALFVRLPDMACRAWLYVWHRKWRPEWKTQEHKAWEERLNTRIRLKRQARLARERALHKSAGA